MNADFLDIIKEIRGTGKAGEEPTDGIWYELTKKPMPDGTYGIYNDMVAKAAKVTAGAPTLTKATNLLSNLNLAVTWVNPDGSKIPGESKDISPIVITDEMVDAADSPFTDKDRGKWNLKIPKGKDGSNGFNGKTPQIAASYDKDTGDLKFNVEYVEVTDG